jgi:hypothetical protein
MRQAVQADEYTPLKLNDQNMKDDVSITQAYLNTGKQNPTWKLPKLSTEKTCGQRVLPILVFCRLYLS